MSVPKLKHELFEQQQAADIEPQESVRFGRRFFIYNKDIAALTDKDIVPPIQKAVAYVTTTFSKALRERSEQLHQRTIEGKRITSIVNDLGKLSQEVTKNTSYAFNQRAYIPLLERPENIVTALKDMMLLDTQYLLFEEKRKELLTILASEEYKATLAYCKACEEQAEKGRAPDLGEIQQKKEQCIRALQEMPIIKSAVVALYDDLLDTLTPQMAPLEPDNAVVDPYLQASQTVALSSDDEFLGGKWFATWRYLGSYSDVATEVATIRAIAQGYVRLLETVQRRIKEISLGQEPVADELAGHKAILKKLEECIQKESRTLKTRRVSHSVNAARHYAAQQLEKGRDIRRHLQLLETLIDPKFRPYSIALGRLLAYLEQGSVERLFAAVKAAYALEPVNQPLSKTIHTMIDEILANVGPRTLHDVDEKSHLMNKMLEVVAFGKGKKDDALLQQAQGKEFGEEFRELVALYASE